jgi:hypothetical protein
MRHNDAARRHRAEQDYARARSELEKALSVIDCGPPRHSSEFKQLLWHRAHADLLEVLGEVSIEQGRPDLARDALEQALREHAGPSYAESADISTILNNLGVSTSSSACSTNPGPRCSRQWRSTARLGASPRQSPPI